MTPHPEGVRRKGGARMLGLLPSAIRNRYPRHVLVVVDVAEEAAL